MKTKSKVVKITVRDGKVKKDYKDIFIEKDLLEQIKFEANKDFFLILGNSRTKPYSNRSETTQKLLEQDIQTIYDFINKEYEWFMIYQNLFNDIIVFLKNGSYTDLFEKFIDIRKEIMNSFKQELENLFNILTRKMTNAPWRNYLEWDEEQIKFVEKKSESRGMIFSLKTKFQSIRN